MHDDTKLTVDRIKIEEISDKSSKLINVKLVAIKHKIGEINHSYKIILLVLSLYA